MRRLWVVGVMLLAAAVTLSGCSVEDRYRRRISETVPETNTDVAVDVLMAVAIRREESVVFDTPGYNVHFSEADKTLTFTLKHDSSYLRSRSRESMMENMREIYRPIVFAVFERAAESPQFEMPDRVEINLYFRTHVIGPVQQRTSRCTHYAYPYSGTSCEEVIVNTSLPTDHRDHMYLSTYTRADDGSWVLDSESYRDL